MSSINYIPLQQPSKENEPVTCLNCRAYGIFEDFGKILTVPCTNCARDNNFTWNGNRCYGAQNAEELGAQAYALTVYEVQYLNRHSKFMEIAKNNNTTCIQEIMRDMPYEVLDNFMDFVSAHPMDCLICK